MNTLEKLGHLKEELDYKRNLLLSPELKDTNPNIFKLLKVNTEFSGGTVTSLLTLISNNIIGVDGKLVKISPLTINEVTIRIYGNVKHVNEMEYVLNTVYEAGLLNDFPSDLLPEYLQELYKNKNK